LVITGSKKCLDSSLHRLGHQRSQAYQALLILMYLRPHRPESNLLEIFLIGNGKKKNVNKTLIANALIIALITKTDLEKTKLFKYNLEIASCRNDVAMVNTIKAIC
jgi:hypothetical protein